MSLTFVAVLTVTLITLLLSLLFSVLFIRNQYKKELIDIRLHNDDVIIKKATFTKIKMVNKPE